MASVREHLHVARQDESISARISTRLVLPVESESSTTLTHQDNDTDGAEHDTQFSGASIPPAEQRAKARSIESHWPVRTHQVPARRHRQGGPHQWSTGGWLVLARDP